MNDFLLELHTEELPPKLLTRFVQNLADNISAELGNAELSYETISTFATPRRLAVLVHSLAEQSSDVHINRKGPLASAKEQAIAGFAKSCGVSVAELELRTTDKGEYYFYEATQAGKQATELLIGICTRAIKNMHFSRPMRWGANSFSFIRPVHSVIALLGSEVLPGEILGCTTGNTTTGLRFRKNHIVINYASEYANILRTHGIEADFTQRKTLISQQIAALTQQKQVTIVPNEALLNEVCAIVENPTAFMGEFDKEFLDLPLEVISSSLAEHQKYWTVVDDNGKLLNKFVAVSNIHPEDMSVIINGNQKVVRPRLADAQFFYAQDKKTTLESKVEKLKTVAFMQGLGSLFDKTQRIVDISSNIATHTQADLTATKRAALLLKADLTTGMVDEFASLQGVMGAYYARFDGEEEVVANAIKMHYHPRFAGDSLPSDSVSIAVALADKLDTICGVFVVGKAPTGSKDPFALRRLALGVMRIIIENNIALDLKEIITTTLSLYPQKTTDTLADDIHSFMLERLKNYYDEQNIASNTLTAASIINNNPLDLHHRVLLLNEFMLSADAVALIEVNKRIANMLKDATTNAQQDIVITLPIEQKVYDAIQNAPTDNYSDLMQYLLSLKPLLDTFFGEVLINDADEHKRNTRLTLISQVRALFLRIADFARLQ